MPNGPGGSARGQPGARTGSGVSVTVAIRPAATRGGPEENRRVAAHPRPATAASLSATHLTASKIAERLFVSRHTVKAELRAIYGKLGCLVPNRPGHVDDQVGGAAIDNPQQFFADLVGVGFAGVLRGGSRSRAVRPTAPGTCQTWQRPGCSRCGSHEDGHRHRLRGELACHLCASKPWGRQGPRAAPEGGLPGCPSYHELTMRHPRRHRPS